jgi:hypothetical protein
MQTHYQREYFAEKNAKRKLKHFISETISFLGAVALIYIWVLVVVKIAFKEI